MQVPPPFDAGRLASQATVVISQQSVDDSRRKAAKPTGKKAVALGPECPIFGIIARYRHKLILCCLSCDDGR